MYILYFCILKIVNNNESEKHKMRNILAYIPDVIQKVANNYLMNFLKYIIIFNLKKLNFRIVISI